MTANFIIILKLQEMIKVEIIYKFKLCIQIQIKKKLN